VPVRIFRPEALELELWPERDAGEGASGGESMCITGEDEAIRPPTDPMNGDGGDTTGA